MLRRPVPPPPPAPVNETVRRAQQGDAASFRTLYDAHVGRIYAVCLRILGDRVEAEERTQDVFVRAWDRLGTFRGESAFSTWLYRLAVNEVLRARRAAGRRAARETLSDSVEQHEAAPDERQPGGRGEELERAIAALPEGARTVFVLYDIEGYQHEEIAEVLGIAPGTSKAQLHRARRLLRGALEKS